MYGQVYPIDSFKWGSNENSHPTNRNTHTFPVVTLPIKSFKKRYSSVSELGSGSFGSVVLAKLKNGNYKEIENGMKASPGTLMDPLPELNRTSPPEVFAVKTLSKIPSQMSEYCRAKEVQFIYAVSSHPGLVQVYEVFIDKESLKLHIVMEALDQNLFQLIKARNSCLFSGITLKSILSQLLAGIRHIHRCSYYHRDVKPENILVMHKDNYYQSRDLVPPLRRNDNYIVKLADFGLARAADNRRPYTGYISTRWYRSPEILLRQKQYSYPVDIWAFGCVAVEIATFSPLFPGSNELDQTWKVLEVLGSPSIDGSGFIPLGGFWKEATELSAKMGFHLPYTAGLSIESLVLRNDLPIHERQSLSDMIKGCLTWDPKKRISAEKLCQSPYFNNTVIREEDARAEYEYINSTQDSIQNNISKTESHSSFLDQSLFFAGIPPETKKDKNLNMSYMSPKTLDPYKINNDENKYPHESPNQSYINSHYHNHHSIRRMPQINSSILNFIKLGYFNKEKGIENETSKNNESINYDKSYLKDEECSSNFEPSDEIQKIDAALKSLEEDSPFEHDSNAYLYESSNSNLYDYLGNPSEYQYENPKSDFELPPKNLQLSSNYYNNPDSSIDSQIRIVDAADEDDDNDLNNLGIDTISCLIDDDFAKNAHLFNWAPDNTKKAKPNYMTSFSNEY